MFVLFSCTIVAVTFADQGLLSPIDSTNAPSMGTNAAVSRRAYQARRAKLLNTYDLNRNGKLDAAEKNSIQTTLRFNRGTTNLTVKPPRLR